MMACKTKRETEEEITKFLGGKTVSHSHKFVTVFSDDFPSN